MSLTINNTTNNQSSNNQMNLTNDHPSSSTIGQEGVPHFWSVLRRERKEPLVLEASICDLKDHGVIESDNCESRLEYDSGTLLTWQLSDSYEEGFEGLDQCGGKNPLNFGFSSPDHTDNDKESTYGYGTKRAFMKLANKITIFTHTKFNGTKQYLKVTIDFLEMKNKPPIDSYNSSKKIITKEEYQKNHPYEYGSSVHLRNFTKKMLNIKPEHFKYIIRQHYPTRLNKIKLFINKKEEDLVPPILSKVNLDKYDESHGMFKASIPLKIYINKADKNKFRIYCSFKISSKSKTITYDTENLKRRPHWGGSVSKKNAPNTFNNLEEFDTKELNLECFDYSACRNITDLRPVRADIKNDETQRAPSFEPQHFSRHLGISHNDRHYNFIEALEKVGDNYGMQSVAYLNYKDKEFTKLLGLDSQKNISANSDELSQFCKALGGIQEQVRRLLQKKRQETTIDDASDSTEGSADSHDDVNVIIAGSNSLGESMSTESPQVYNVGHSPQNMEQVGGGITLDISENVDSIVDNSVEENIKNEVSSLLVNTINVNSHSRHMYSPMSESAFCIELEKLVASENYIRFKQNANSEKEVDKTWVAMLQTIISGEKIQDDVNTTKV